jgi:hypothetical protein
MFLLICFRSRKGACCDSCEDWVFIVDAVVIDPTRDMVATNVINWQASANVHEI